MQSDASLASAMRARRGAKDLLTQAQAQEQGTSRAPTTPISQPLPHQAEACPSGAAPKSPTPHLHVAALP